MATENDRLKAARALFAAIEQGDTGALRALYAENALQVEHPNKLKPKGDRRSIEALARDLARGKQLLAEEHYEVKQAVAEGETIALRVEWRGVLAVPLGTLRPGDEMVCESAIFLKVRDDRIVEQHNYDCFGEF